MTQHISTRAAAARENARASSGEFGNQLGKAPVSDVLAAPTETDQLCDTTRVNQRYRVPVSVFGSWLFPSPSKTASDCLYDIPDGEPVSVKHGPFEHIEIYAEPGSDRELDLVKGGYATEVVYSNDTNAVTSYFYGRPIYEHAVHRVGRGPYQWHFDSDGNLDSFTSDRILTYSEKSTPSDFGHKSPYMWSRSRGVETETYLFMDENTGELYDLTRILTLNESGDLWAKKVDSIVEEARGVKTTYRNDIAVLQEFDSAALGQPQEITRDATTGRITKIAYSEGESFEAVVALGRPYILEASFSAETGRVTSKYMCEWTQDSSADSGWIDKTWVA